MRGTTCPTCGQPVRARDVSSEALHAALRVEGDRQVYRCDDGRWIVSHSGAEFPWSSVEALIKAGLLHSHYSNCPNDAYWLGQTIDVPSALAARRAEKAARTAKRAAKARAA